MDADSALPLAGTSPSPMPTMRDKVKHQRHQKSRGKQVEKGGLPKLGIFGAFSLAEDYATAAKVFNSWAHAKLRKITPLPSMKIRQQVTDISKQARATESNGGTKIERKDLDPTILALVEEWERLPLLNPSYEYSKARVRLIRAMLAKQGYISLEFSFNTTIKNEEKTLAWKGIKGSPLTADVVVLRPEKKLLKLKEIEYEGIWEGQLDSEAQIAVKVEPAPEGHNEQKTRHGGKGLGKGRKGRVRRNWRNVMAEWKSKEEMAVEEEKMVDEEDEDDIEGEGGMYIKEPPEPIYVEE